MTTTKPYLEIPDPSLLPPGLKQPGVSMRTDGRFMIVLRDGAREGRRPRYYYGATPAEAWWKWLRAEHPHLLPDLSRSQSSAVGVPRTFGELLDAYLDDLERQVKLGAKKPKTQTTYEGIARNALDKGRVDGLEGRSVPIKSIGVEEMTPFMVDQLVEWMLFEREPRYSSSQARQAQQLIGSVYTWARKKRKWTHNNPVEDSDTVTVTTETIRDEDIPTVEQVRYFLDYWRNDWLYPWWRTAFTTGVRPAELAGIREEYLYAPEGTEIPDMLYVVEQAQEIRLAARPSIGREASVEHLVHAPKSKQGVRRLGLTTETGRALLAAADRAAVMAARKPGWDPSWEGYLFRAPRSLDGSPLTVSTVNKLFGKRLDKAGLPHWPLYCARHFAASVWIAQGLSSWRVGKLLGHRDGVLVEQRYAHLLEKVDMKATALMATMFADLIPAQMPDPDDEPDPTRLPGAAGRGWSTA